MPRKIMLLIVLIGWLAVFPAFSPAPAAQTPSAPPDRGEKLRLFDQVWRTVYDNYYDGKFHGVDWRRQKEVYRPQAEAAESRGELYGVFRRMLGTLGDAHTRIYAPEDGFDRYRPAGTTVGVMIRPVEGRPTVTWVEPESEAYQYGIRPGFRLLQIDGQPVETVIGRIQQDLVASSTSTALELQSFDRIFYGPRGSAVTARFEDDAGRARQVTLTRRFVEYQRRAIPRLLPHRIGYIELTGFGQEIERDFELAMQQMQGTRGLILDLRNNGGGFVTSVMQVASYFLPEETDLGEFIPRQGRATKRRTVRARQFYRAPLIVLVSSRSASGAEIFAAAMQERRRAVIVGTHATTCGCLLGVSRTIKLPDGGKLNVSDTDFRTAMGRRIEGVGIRPDLLIGVRAPDLLLGRDRPLESAMDHLGRLVVFGDRHREIDFTLKIPVFGAPSSAGNWSGSLDRATYQQQPKRD